MKKIIEKFLKASTSNKETSAIVAKIFLDTLEKCQVPLQNLVNINCDSCSILRGKRSGAIKKIAVHAPHINDCDIGGDGLHRVANSFKRACDKTFPRVNNVLNNIKYEIRSSPAKVDNYIAAADQVGDDPVMPASFCQSRWLDRYKASTDVIRHFHTLKQYYLDAKIPRKSVESRDTTDSHTLSSNSECEESK